MNNIKSYPFTVAEEAAFSKLLHYYLDETGLHYIEFPDRKRKFVCVEVD